MSLQKTIITDPSLSVRTKDTEIQQKTEGKIQSRIVSVRNQHGASILKALLAIIFLGIAAAGITAALHTDGFSQNISAVLKTTAGQAGVLIVAGTISALYICLIAEKKRTANIEEDRLKNLETTTVKSLKSLLDQKEYATFITLAEHSHNQGSKKIASEYYRNLLNECIKPLGTDAEKVRLLNAISLTENINDNLKNVIEDMLDGLHERGPGDPCIHYIMNNN